MFSYSYPRPAVTVDGVVFRIPEDKAEVLLIKRGNPPFEGSWAIPGGFIDMEETPEEAIVRELAEETGISGVEFFQYHAYGAVSRDPRHRTISIAYAGLLHDQDQIAIGGDDAAEAGWFPVNQLPPLAFDHHEIVADAIEFGIAKGWF
jgi:8-oxo-dGTP diphosphatase